LCAERPMKYSVGLKRSFPLRLSALVLQAPAGLLYLKAL
jgi:hypothetical protein